MSTGTKSLLVVIILLLGVVAAMPFHRDPTATDISNQKSIRQRKKKAGRDLFIVESNTNDARTTTSQPIVPTIRTDDAGSPAKLDDLQPPPELQDEFPIDTPVGNSSSNHSGAPKERTHTIGENETLYDIAKKYWGKGDLYLELYKANVDVLINPNQLPVGRSIVIPDRPNQRPVKETIKKMVPIKWKRRP